MELKGSVRICKNPHDDGGHIVGRTPLVLDEALAPRFCTQCQTSAEAYSVLLHISQTERLPNWDRRDR